MASAGTSSATWTVSPGGGYDVAARFWFKSGAGLTDPIGRTKTVRLGDCEDNSTAAPFSVTAAGLPWAIRALSYDPKTKTTRGTVLHVHFSVTGPSCSAVIDGTSPTADDGQLAFLWVKGNKILYVDSTTISPLHVYDVSGCAGVFNDGEQVLAGAGYNILKRLVITSP
ncbi:MAG TPA: hypothetical protein VGH27_05075 [Streptosporangiaceae bacterium]